MEGTNANAEKTKRLGVAVSWALPVAIVVFLLVRGVRPKPFFTLTDSAPWAWEITTMGFMLKVAHDQKESVKDFYWAHAVLTTALAAFGGGFLAPLLVAHSPVPLVEETYFWMVILAWYMTHHIPFVSDLLNTTMKSTPGKVVFTILFAIFKTNQIVGGCEIGAQAVREEELLPNSRYFHVAFAAPLLCGFLSGCGGGLVLYYEKGLSEGQWAIRASFFAPVLYYGATRLAEIDKLDAKMAICALRVLGDLLPAPRERMIGNVTAFGYQITGIRRGTPGQEAASSSKSKV
mmetsp:Transcript_3165/g.7412  ORF Transcript_3165/g.7412 Transcript_3165/m.7412 type:complete len:290 (-) Transcript_3165:93-962(-)|eukprot:CAMPEP_0170631094 /NCGR_PEP_ID=MMETSP0224-20130122/34415_1 /TAXON_ID=285029 /ORGANISM="Togula jolla, Strain CCCM 725" /LENGTH=289 /DNA_ID=CAMNT_0010959325 /DNA_START=53 /DNA_END=922 /DNA_ORIENTATION=+